MSVYISQLPEYSGSAADLRWFIMNNSGQTTTFKYSGYTSPFRISDGFNSTISTYYNSNVVPQKLSGIIGGTGNTMSATSSYTDGFSNYIFGGTGNVMDLNGPQPGQHYGHTIIGGNYNTLRFRANAAVNTIIGGQSNTMDCYYGTNTIIGGSNNTSQGASNNTIISAQSSTITGGDRMGIWGGYSQSVGGNYDNNIYGGFDNTISAGGFNTIVGGSTNGITASNDSNSIVGGKDNTIAGTAQQGSIIGGELNTMTSSNKSAIIGGESNTITSSPQSSTIGGSGNTISSKTNAHMIGCSGRTATRSNATMVENLVVFNYAGLNFADDTAAAAGGVVLGQVYHNNGALRIRIV